MLGGQESEVGCQSTQWLDYRDWKTIIFFTFWSFHLGNSKHATDTGSSLGLAQHAVHRCWPLNEAECSQHRLYWSHVPSTAQGQDVNGNMRSSRSPDKGSFAKKRKTSSTREFRDTKSEENEVTKKQICFPGSSFITRALKHHMFTHSLPLGTVAAWTWWEVTSDSLEPLTQVWETRPTQWPC